MPELEPITREEKFLNGEVGMTPITREEKILAGEDVETITRREYFLKKYRGGGGGDITVEEITITENGTTTAPSGKAYSPIHTNVPQPSLSTLDVSENGDYDAPSGTAYNRVKVNVPLPENAYLKKTATTSMSDAEQLPVASAVVSVTDKDKAELFLTSDGVVSEDNSPYTYRPSPSGKSYVDLSVVGGTVAWNQLADKSTAFEKTWTADTSTYYGSFGSLDKNVKILANHIYLFSINTQRTISTNNLLGVYIGSSELGFDMTYANGEANGVKAIIKKVSSNGTYSNISYSNYSGKRGFSNGDSITVDKVQIIDLTQMFGSTIADYIYSLEQATAGSGIAWLKSYGYLTKDYYAYQSDKLESVNVASRKVYDSNDTLVATYPLDSDLTLRGIPKLDANNNLYYDGDIYNADGSVKRKYGVVDLGTLKWYKSGENNFYAQLPQHKVVAGNTPINGLTSNGMIFNQMPGSGNVEYIIITAIGYETYTYAQFKTAMSGVQLVYELAIPTSETADAFATPQLVGSTEEFVDAQTSASTPTRDVDIPVGQDSKYVNGNIYIKYLDSVTTGDIELADENAIIPLENTTYISSNGSASIDYWSKEV